MRRSRRGAGITEYTILIVFFAGLTIAALRLLGASTSGTLDSVAARLAGTSSSSQSSASEDGEILSEDDDGGGVGASGKGNNGLGNGEDGAPPGSPPVENDGAGSGPGSPGARGRRG